MSLPSGSTVRLGILGAVLVYLGSAAFNRASTLGVFRSFSDTTNIHGVGLVHVIPNTINAEDIHYHAESGFLFTACQGVDGSRSKWFPPLSKLEEPDWAEKGDGGLRVINPRTLIAKRLTLEGFSGPFSTHGLDVLTDPYNPKAVFIHAVNHVPNPDYLSAPKENSTFHLNKAASVVEIFYHVLHSTSARHIGTISHPFIQTPNDIYSTGPYSFYVTNDHRHREGSMRLVEEFGMFAKWSTVVRVEARVGEEKIENIEADVALRGLHCNNGLGRGRFPGEVIICDASGGQSHFASIIPSSQRLRVESTISLPTNIDNPFWFNDPYAIVTGRNASGLINAGLVHGVHLENELVSGPVASIVWHSTPDPEKPGKWVHKTIFRDDGKVLKSASAAVLLAIDPKDNEGRKQAWLYTTGFLSKGVVVVKVDL